MLTGLQYEEFSKTCTMQLRAAKWSLSDLPVLTRKKSQR